jgi:hypothetical protein
MHRRRRQPESEPPPAEPSIRFTPTERRIMDVLADGLPKTWTALFDCFNDELQSRDNLRVHMFNIRRKLAPTGWTVVAFDLGGVTHWVYIETPSQTT